MIKVKRYTKKWKEKISKTMTGRKYSKERKKNISNGCKGKKMPKSFRLKASIKFKNNNPMHNIEIKNKWLKIMKEKVWNNKEIHKKISLSNKGKKLSEEHKIKLVLSHLGIKNSKESKEKNRIKQIELMKIPENREKRRIARQKQIILNGGGPTIGRNETRILDELELSLNKKIIRQKPIIGYWVDGYISELNLVIEVDERPKTNERDIRREKEIKEELNCKFLRIGDYKNVRR